MDYLLIVCATLLFALQFFFNQSFQKQMGNSLQTALLFSLYSSVVAAAVLFVINGLQLSFSWFSLLVALLSAANGILFTYCSIQAFATVNLANYSVFSMLGGMLLPFLTGILFYREEFSIGKLFCCACIILSVLIGFEKGNRISLKNSLCYAGVFILNGMSGVLSKIHQSNTAQAVDSESFMIIKFLLTVLITAVILLMTEKKLRLIPLRAMLASGGFGIFTGIGNLFLMIALLTLPASVQYPIVTGGTMIFSFFLGLLRRERLTCKGILSILFAVLSTVLIIL